MSDRIFYDRDDAGRTISEKLMNKVEDSANDFRTVVISDGETTTMLKTKGGMPEVTQTKKSSSDAAACVLFPLVEKTLDGEETQDDRLYYHDHDADQNVEARRKFSSDGVLSVLVKPLRRLRLYSGGLKKYITVWFADHSATPVPVDTGSPDYLAAAPGVKATETQRTWHTPVFIPYDNKAGDDSDLKSLGFVFKRLKDVVFSTAEYGLFTAVFGGFTSPPIPGTEVIGSAKLPNGASERMSIRTFYGTAPYKVKEMFFNGLALTIASPGGLLSPVRNQELAILNPQQQTFSATKVRPLTDASKLVVFGKCWHGFLEYTLDGSGSRILWDSADKRKQLLVHNTNPNLGQVVEIVPYVINDYPRYYDFSVPSVNTEGASIPGGAAFKKYAVLNTGRLGCTIDAPVLLPNNTDTVSDILYRDENGVVWKLTLEDVAGFLKVRVSGRVDDFLEDKTSCSVEIANIFLGVGENYAKIVVKNSPDSKKAAVIVYSGSDPMTMLTSFVDAYFLLDFSGDGSTDTATYGQGISCSWSGAAGWNVSGPLGQINTYRTIEGWHFGNGGTQPGFTRAIEPVSQTTTGTWPNEITTSIYEHQLTVPDTYVSKNKHVQGLMVDVVFDRENLCWKRIDYERITDSFDTRTFSGFSAMTVVETDVTGCDPVYSVGVLSGVHRFVFTTTRIYKLSTQSENDGITSGHTTTEERYWGGDLGLTLESISNNVTYFGLPEEYPPPVIEAVGHPNAGYPYIGRYLAGGSYTTKICYENAVSDFLGENGVRIAYDPVNEKIVRLDADSYGNFV